MKKCTKCGLEKSRAEFAKDKSKKFGLQSWCRSCHSDYNTGGGADLIRRYGIGAEQKNIMVQKQNSRCAICRKRFSSGKDTQVDHCHTEGTIRGILCRKCNNGLGQFDDSTELLRRAVVYLEGWQSGNAAGC